MDSTLTATLLNTEKAIPTTVLIVGAGPVGLWLAYELKLAGVDDVLVIDSKPRPIPEEKNEQAKALAMSPSTVEILASRNVAQSFLRTGLAVPRTHFGTLPAPIWLNVLGIKHPHVLFITQSDTEKIFRDLCEHVGVKFKWEWEFMSLEQNESRVLVSVRHRSGGETGAIQQQQTIETSWVVGCDGTRSSVRLAAGIAFEGTSAEFTSWLADVHLTDPPPNLPYYRFCSDGAGSIFPVPGRTYYRTAGLQFSTFDHPTSQVPSFEDVKKFVGECFGRTFGAHSPVWISRFGNAARLAASYRVGRVFLAGDAAHQFFPAGGQGMNLGIQDANNLAWKLAAVINRKDSYLDQPERERLLNSYAEERRSAAQPVLKNVQAQTLMFRARTPQELAVRDYFTEALKLPALNEVWARRLSGFSDPLESYIHNYRASQPNDDNRHPDAIEKEEQLIGSRVTHLFDNDRLDGYDTLHAMTAGYRFVIVLLETGKTRFSSEVAFHEVTRRWEDLVVIFPLATAPVDDKWNNVEAMIVRPDMRVAWICHSDEPLETVRASLEAILKWWLGSRALK